MEREPESSILIIDGHVILLSPPSFPSGLSSLINGNHAANLLNNNSLLAAATSNGVLSSQLLGGNNQIHSNNNNDLNILNNNNNPLMLDKNGINGNVGVGCGDHLSTTSSSTSTPSITGVAGGEQPDPDFIKMFVGQVPKSMDEEQLRDMFEEYGRVHSINVLRDKVTGVSKGEFCYCSSLSDYYYYYSVTPTSSIWFDIQSNLLLLRISNW